MYICYIEMFMYLVRSELLTVKIYVCNCTLFKKCACIHVRLISVYCNKKLSKHETEKKWSEINATNLF